MLQVHQHPRRSYAGTALRWGGLFGLVAIGLEVAGRLAAGAQLSRTLISLAELACYFVAGVVAARRAGRIEPGFWAGLFAGGAGSLGPLALVSLASTAARYGMGTGLNSGFDAHQVPALVPAASMMGVLLSCVIGAGLGALGAVLGSHGDEPVRVDGR